MNRATKSRIALWDNARFIIMALVVIGHMLTTVRTDSALAFGLYAYIYLFHMPAMILLSGYFSKAEVTPNSIRSTLALIVTWITFEVLWIGYRGLIDGRAFNDSFLIVPSWTLWFLVTLITMRILLPFIARLRHPLIVSLVIALVAGLSPLIGTGFSASRTLSFLPFFVFGWLARERGWLSGDRFMKPSRKLKAGAWAVLAGIAAVFVAWPTMRSTFRVDKWLTWRDDYWSMIDLAGALPAFAGLGMRSLFITIAFVMTLAVLVIIPRRTSVITVWGTRTLYLYLLHGFVVYALRHYGVADFIGSFGTVGTLLLISMGVALSMLLSMAWVQRLTKPIIEPNIDWMLAKLPQRTAA
jgi:fucose 4-O-acetylase-like acetyltransferase